MNQLDVHQTQKISGKFEEIPRPLLEVGEYPAITKDWKIQEKIFKGAKLILNCDVTVNGVVYEITYFCNVKLTEDRQIIPPGRSSHLYKLFQALLPSSSRSRNLDDLIGLSCIATIGTSDKDEKKQPKPVEEWYSVVRKLRLAQEAIPEYEDILPF